ncbi:alpha/beta fold hydrolase [Vibrio sonorensis]|uniref:alpha/beta fold hydrolase n=1 Tax=Vibrio sonorensis TaxID=1004316 RepID=UPI0008DAF950|nr:alpha/beta fold hydrolase [Vibrio sonorensis]
MNQFAVDSHHIAYQDIGQGPVLVLGHSFLWDSQMWAPQIEVLSQHYRCIVPELWSHGASSHAPQGKNSLKNYAQAILELMDHLQVETFSIIGLSVGGMWGAELTCMAPERVKSLVLMDTFVGLEPEVAHNKYFAMLETISAAQMVPMPIVENVVPLFFAPKTIEANPVFVQRFAKELAAISGEQAVEVARIGRMVFGRRDLMEEVEKLALPVLIAAGQQDKPRPMLESFLMHDAIAGSQLVQIPDAGHIANLEQPEFVNKMLVEFLSGLYQ